MPENQISLLESNYGTLTKDFGELESDIKKTENVLNDVIELLEIPDRLDKDLRTYDNTLTLISELLAGAILVPPVSAEAAEAKNVVDSVQRPVHQVHKQVSEINRNIKPFRSRLKVVEGFLKKAQGWVDEAKAFTDGEKRKLMSMHKSLNVAEKSVYRTVDELALNIFCGLINAVIEIPIKVLHAMVKVMHEVLTSIGVLTKELHFIKRVSMDVIKLNEELELVLSPLQFLDKLLDKSVKINLVLDTVKIKIRKLLSTTSHIPGFSKLMNLAMKTLKPALHALKLDFVCEIPSLSTLVKKFEVSLNLLSDLDVHFKKIEADFIHFHGPKSFISGIHGIDINKILCKHG